MIDYIPHWASDNKEIGVWRKNVLSHGILLSGFPNVNQYAFSLAWNGIPGLLLFLFLPVYFLYQCFRRRRAMKTSPLCILLVILAGQLVSMISAAMFPTYPLILGLLYCGLLKEKGK